MVFQILNIPGIGPVKFWKEFNKTKNLEVVYNFFKLNFDYINIDINIEKIQCFNQEDITCIGFWQPEYPSKLKRLHDAPPLIWTIGDVALLKKPQIAIVGGRNASFHGINFAKKLSQDLAEHGFTITSGLARGIDKSAHQGALNHSTIAVLAGGADKLYPQENKSLYDDLIKNHLVVSEMPPGVEPTANLFPRRNRIIAALSDGLCVIEAAFKSGSLLTAKFALEIGIPIFACPGHPLDPRAKGSNALIKDGAYLLEGVEDIFHELKFERAHPVEKKLAPLQANDLSKIVQELLNYLSHTPVKIDDLLQDFAQYSTDEVLIALSELELKSAVHRPNPNLVVLG